MANQRQTRRILLRVISPGASFPPVGFRHRSSFIAVTRLFFPCPENYKRVFNIDVEVCGRCGGAATVIACIEEQDVIDRILAHLHRMEQETPTPPLLMPPTRAPPGTLALFAGKELGHTSLDQHGRH